jgi:hypothetical protein
VQIRQRGKIRASLRQKRNYRDEFSVLVNIVLLLVRVPHSSRSLRRARAFFELEHARREENG